MGKRKKPYQPKSFESTGISNDTSSNIYESMLLAPAFQDLSKNQRLLYVCMKAQYYGKRKPGKDNPEIESLQGDDLFYFNFILAENMDYTHAETKGNFTKMFMKLKTMDS